jgi:hypothetical protein
MSNIDNNIITDSDLIGVPKIRTKLVIDESGRRIMKPDLYTLFLSQQQLIVLKITVIALILPLPLILQANMSIFQHNVTVRW